MVVRNAHARYYSNVYSDCKIVLIIMSRKDLCALGSKRESLNTNPLLIRVSRLHVEIISVTTHALGRDGKDSQEMLHASPDRLHVWDKH